MYGHMVKTRAKQLSGSKDGAKDEKKKASKKKE